MFVVGFNAVRLNLAKLQGFQTSYPEGHSVPRFWVSLKSAANSGLGKEVDAHKF